MTGWISGNRAALAVSKSFFLLALVARFFVGRWKASNLVRLRERIFGNVHFGIVISWFLVGGVFYCAHTMVAAPALVRSAGT
jgi:SSS family solute:Na+ symporter